MNKILVTGGTGLLGSHLIYKLLSRGEAVKATCRKSSNRDIVRKVAAYYTPGAEELFKKIEWIECDLSDPADLSLAMSDARLVYHCAAMVSFESGDNEKIIKNNTAVTSNIVKACLENKISKLCHVSSVAALGGSDGELTINEESRWNSEKPHPAYNTSKYLSEQEVWNGISQGLNAVIVLPSIILGPGDWKRSSSAIFGTIAGGLPFYTDGIKAYVDVNDVADAMILLMESGISGEKFILSSENLTNQKVFSMIAQNLGVRKPFIKIPRFIGPFLPPVIKMIRAFSGKKLPLTKDILNAAWTRIGYDNSKIKERTGFRLTEIEKSVEYIASIFIKERKITR
ncbi:MAG TPA: NAD-dependent epimerase/dehydratase family protein [Bacteroidales bacterium]|nr:NAD-dependent epimerase/dehydratase family protein [Bacteroidales bacterium]